MASKRGNASTKKPTSRLRGRVTGRFDGTIEGRLARAPRGKGLSRAQLSGVGTEIRRIRGDVDALDRALGKESFRVDNEMVSWPQFLKVVHRFEDVERHAPALIEAGIFSREELGRLHGRIGEVAERFRDVVPRRTFNRQMGYFGKEIRALKGEVSTLKASAEAGRVGGAGERAVLAHGGMDINEWRRFLLEQGVKPGQIGEILRRVQSAEASAIASGRDPLQARINAIESSTSLSKEQKQKMILKESGIEEKGASEEERAASKKGRAERYAEVTDRVSAGTVDLFKGATGIMHQALMVVVLALLIYIVAQLFGFF